MQSIQKINVDISRDRNLSEPSVYAKQNDSNSRKVEVTLFDSGIQLSSLTAPGKVFFGKGDNAYVETIQITNGVTEFIIPQNALSSSGRIQAEILILKDDDDTEALTSATFIINCHTQINPSGAIDGENKGDYIGRIVETIDSIVEKIEQIESSEMARTPLPDGAIDLNTLTSSAWWYTAEHRVSITNAPKNISELELIVTKDAISISQILISPTVDDSSIYFRFSHNNGVNWTNWQKSATDADISTLNETLRRIDDALDSKVSSVNGKNGTVTVTGDDIPLEEGSQTIIGPFVTDLSNKFVKLNDDLEDKFTLIENTLDSKVSSVNGKNGTVTVTGADIPLEEGSQTLIGPYVNSINSSVLQMNKNLRNHTSLFARTTTDNITYIKLGSFTGDGLGARAILTINGKKGWNSKSDGGLKVLTLSSNYYGGTTSTDIHTGGTFYDFGYSNEQGTDITDFTQEVKIVLVRPDGYSTKKVDVYIKFNANQYNSFFVTVDYSDGCGWATDVQAITTSDIDPTTDALSSFVVPTKYIGDITKVNSVLESKANSETGNCTLTVSNGTVSNASYSKTGKDVTVNFWFYPADTNEVVVSGLPYVATKNQSGIASAGVGGVRVSYEMSKDNANATLYPETTSEQYCTLTYNLGAYNPQP